MGDVQALLKTLFRATIPNIGSLGITGMTKPRGDILCLNGVKSSNEVFVELWNGARHEHEQVSLKL